MNSYRLLDIIFCTILTVFLVCCSSGGGREPHITPLNAQTGRFLDGPVTGIEYSSEHWSHITGFDGILMTDVDGAFTYQPGEEVTFSIGGVVLGSAQAKRNVTPIDLVPGATNTNNPAVINMCRFLQSLDDDCKPENGIVISEGVRDVLTDFESVDFSAPSLEEIPEVQQMFDTLNACEVFPENVTGEERCLVSADDALIHFEETLIKIEQEEAAAEDVDFSVWIRKPIWNAILIQGQSIPIIGYVTGGTEPYSVEWSLNTEIPYQGVNPPGNIPKLSPGNYMLQLSATDASGKTLSDQRLITVFDRSMYDCPPKDECVVVTILVPENVVVSPGESIALKAVITYGNPPFFYYWSYPSSATYSYADNPLDAVFTFSTRGRYEVRITMQDTLGYDVWIDSLFITVR